MLPSAFIQANVECPSDLPSKCQCMTAYDGQSIEMDCRGALENGILPDLSSVNGFPIFKLHLDNNDIETVPNDAFNGLLFNTSVLEPTLALRNN